MRQISKRDAYIYPSSNIIYRTPEAAAKGLAWKIISEKYEDVMSAGTINILSYSCECDEESQFPYNGCQLHDRQSGYFRRLSIRLQRIILKKYNGGQKMENIPARNTNPPELPEKTCEYCGFGIVKDDNCGNIMCENCYLSDSGLVEVLREELSKRDEQVKNFKILLSHYEKIIR